MKTLLILLCATGVCLADTVSVGVDGKVTVRQETAAARRAREEVGAALAAQEAKAEALRADKESTVKAIAVKLANGLATQAEKDALLLILFKRTFSNDAN